MMNLPIRLNVLPGVDMEKLAQVVRRAVKSHPALLSTIEKREESYYLRYDEKLDRDIPVEEMTVDALEQEAERFAQPFFPDGTPIFRCKVIKAGDGGAVFLDVYHAICDGMSMAQLVDEIGSSFSGKELPADQCYPLLWEEKAYRKLPHFRRDMEYFASRYDRPGWDTLPRIDHGREGSWSETFFKPFHFDREGAFALVKKHSLGFNGLYIAATALTIAAYNGSEDIMFSWTWHGRYDRKRTNSVGSFIKDIPFAVQLRQGLLLSELYETIVAQIRGGVSHGRVSYWEEKGSYHGKDMVCLLYQGAIYELREDYGIFRSKEELPTGPSASNNTLDIEILDGSEFGVLLDYNAVKYERASMERFAELFCGICSQLVRKNKSYTTVGEILHGLSAPPKR
jgi:hypothetical protein